MNIAKIYSDATGRVSKDETLKTTPTEEDAARFQIKHQWLQSSITKEFINSLIKEFNNSIEQAIGLAVTYPEHQNHHKVIHCLIKANELKKLINDNSQI